jgi:methyltransferase (TIGR00027 family)
MAKAASKTGVGPTALVAIEQGFPEDERIIEDDLAYWMLPFFMRTFVSLARQNPFRDWMVRATEKDSPGIWGGMMCRKRYIDEKVAGSISGIDAVVNLGAGFDTRAYRLHSISDIPVWEVDQPENIRTKKARLLKMLGAVPSHVRLVEADFDSGDLGAVLGSHGYSTDKRTFFIWEAVTQYLTEKGIRATFDFLAEAERGSRLAFTYILREFLDGKAMYGWNKAYKRFVKNDEIWIFGMDPGLWPPFLKEYGWQAIEDVGYDELAEKYVKPTGRMLASTPIERIVYAEKL